MNSLVFRSKEIVSGYDEIGNLVSSMRADVDLSFEELKIKCLSEDFKISYTVTNYFLYKHDNLVNGVVETSFCVSSCNEGHVIATWNGLLDKHLNKQCS